jgi:hypothetical protein
MQSPSVARQTGRLALLSSLIGALAVACLIAALLAPTPSAHTMRRETDYFRWQDTGVILQALVMVPVTLGLFRVRAQHHADASPLWAAWGVAAQASLAISSMLIFSGTVADMLYMAPLGLVGVWVLAVSGRAQSYASPAIVWTGRVAGFGLILVGVGFLIYGLFVAPAIFLRPLSNAEIDAQSLTTSNLIAHIFMAVGTLLGRVVYPIWAFLLGRALLRVGDRDSGIPGHVPT